MEGVGLPEVVGVGFGEGEPTFGAVAGVGFKEFVFIDDAPEGVGGDLASDEKASFDAGTVEGLDVEGPAGVGAGAEGRQGLLDGGEEVFGGDLAGGAFVGADRGVGDAVLSVVIPPGLDGSPGEVPCLTVLVDEGHLANGLVSRVKAVAGSMFEGSEDAHFEVVGNTFHQWTGNVADGVRTVECSDRVAGCFSWWWAEAARCQSGNGGCLGGVRRRSLCPEIDLVG